MKSKRGKRALSPEEEEEGDEESSVGSVSEDEEEEEEAEEEEEEKSVSPRVKHVPGLQIPKDKVGKTPVKRGGRRLLPPAPGVLVGAILSDAAARRLRGIKRPVKPSSYVHPSVDTPKYRKKIAKKLEAFEATRLAYDYDVLEVMDEEDVPREERTDMYLRMECELKGVHSAGPRALLLERLDAFDAGEKVLMGSMLATEKIDEKSLSRMIVERTPLSVKARPKGEAASLMGVHKDVLIKHMFPHMRFATLMRLARTCKNMCAIIIPVLDKRAKDTFGKGGTPMALSCVEQLDRVERDRSAPRLKELLKTLRIHSRDMLPVGSAGVGDYFFEVDAEEFYRINQVHVNDATNYVGVKAAIVKYGTIEGLAKKYADERAAQALRKEEHAAMLKKGPDRLTELNRALQDEYGYPDMFMEIVPNESAEARRKRLKEEKAAEKRVYGSLYKSSKKRRAEMRSAKDNAVTPGRDQLRLTPVGDLVMTHVDVITNAYRWGNANGKIPASKNRLDFLKKCAGFVIKHVPKVVATVTNNFPPFTGTLFPQFVARLAKVVPDFNWTNADIGAAVICINSLFTFDAGHHTRSIKRKGITIAEARKTPFMLTCGEDLSKNPGLDTLLKWIARNHEGDWDFGSTRDQKEEEKDRKSGTWALYQMRWASDRDPFIAIVWKSFNRMPHFVNMRDRDRLSVALDIVSSEVGNKHLDRVTAYLSGAIINVFAEEHIRFCNSHSHCELYELSGGMTRNVTVFFVHDC